MSDAEHTIVAAILQQNSRIADVVSLPPEFFSVPECKALFGFAVGYYKKRGRKNALDFALARTRLESSKAKIANKLLALVAEYENYERITGPEFRDSLAKLQAERRQALIREHGAAAAEALVEDRYDEAARIMREGMIAVDEADFEDDRPTDIRGTDEIELERHAVEHPDEDAQVGGFDVGFPKLMRAVSLRRRELTVLGGYTSDGKTQFSKVLAYNACRNSGATVLFTALEMDKREMKVLFVAQHAAMIDPRGVDYRQILNGTPTPEDKKLYLRALDDFQFSNDEDGEEIESPFGRLIVWAPRKRINLDNYCDRLRAIKQDQGLDMAVADYLELIQPSRDLGQYRLNVKESAEVSKALARELDLWHLINHQISRGGREAAEKRSPNHYLLRDLGESSGVEKASDQAIWIYSDDGLKEEREARVGIAKARKGRTIVEGWHVYADFRKSLIGPISR